MATPRLSRQKCDHYGEIDAGGARPRAAACEDCGLRNEGHLRFCLTCGYVGCCESEQSHDTRHWRETGHAVIRSLPLGESSFTWCYEHRAYLTE